MAKKHSKKAPQHKAKKAPAKHKPKAPAKPPRQHSLSRYKLIDCCPAPRALYPILDQLKRETGCVYQSIYRGTDAANLLAKCGKHTQAYLYEHQNDPGFNPANPPGRSTHELCSDGVAYDRPVGSKLKWWQCGIDVDDADVGEVIAAAAKHGWHVRRPYSGGSEYHHLNFTSRPSRWRLYWQRAFGR